MVTGTLDNGLTFFIHQNDQPENRAELRLVVNAGSILEEDDQLGLAHFVEHMAFNGTRNFEKQALVDYLESIGMRFGPDINAYTSFDETVYMLQVPMDDPEVLSTAFQILVDWASGVLFDPEEVDKERGVVIEEWRARRGGQARIQDQQVPLMFHGSRYAERLPIGDPEILRTAPTEVLRRFYEDWYRPDLMAVIAVESGGRPDAVSTAGAQGLMQLMPATAQRFGVSDVLNPKENIRGGAQYLGFLLRIFGGDPVLALAAYNAGEGAVARNKGVPPFDETRGYVPKVLAAWQVARMFCQVPPRAVTDPCAFSAQPKRDQGG